MLLSYFLFSTAVCQMRKLIKFQKMSAYLGTYLTVYLWLQMHQDKSEIIKYLIYSKISINWMKKIKHKKIKH